MSILGKNFGSRVSLENREGSDEQTEVRSEVDVRVAETRADVAEDALRRTEEMDQIEEVREQIEGGLEVAEALENFKTNLSGKIATGGLTKGEAEYASDLCTALESFTGHRGFVAAPTISTENFGTASANKAATQVSVEGIKDSLAKAWEWIKEKYQQFVGWIKKHYLKWFGDYENMKKRAEAIKEKAKDLKGSIKENDFENKTLASAFTVNGALTDGAGIKSGLDAAMSAVANLSKFTSQAKDVNDILEKTVEEVASTVLGNDGKPINKTQDFDRTGALKTKIANASTSALGLISGSNGDATKFNLSGDKTQISRVLPGEFAIVVSPFGSAPDDLDKALDTTVKFSKLSLKTASSADRLKTLKQDEIMDICNNVISFAESGIESRKVVEDAVKDSDRLSKNLDAFAKEAKGKINDNKDQDTDTKVADTKLMNKLPKAVLAWATTPLNVSKDLLGYGAKLSKASLDYCQASIGQYGETN